MSIPSLKKIIIFLPLVIFYFVAGKLDFSFTINLWILTATLGVLLYLLFDKKLKQLAEKKDHQARLSEAYDQALEGWSCALDLRDKETEGHARRVAELSVKLASRLGLKGQDLVNIRRGALLHDIGKMAIPDNILYKPGGLTPEEWIIMRKHPIYAADFISHMSYFHGAKDIPYSHHERWDGSGYPEGLKGKSIPFFARIFSIVDVWDAMHSRRPYHVPLCDSEAIDHMVSLSGTQFDPDLLPVFIEMMKNKPLEETKPGLYQLRVKAVDLEHQPA
jgi:putative nucleotidyltransferase with HDIG domain